MELKCLYITYIHSQAVHHFVIYGVQLAREPLMKDQRWQMFLITAVIFISLLTGATEYLMISDGQSIIRHVDGSRETIVDHQSSIEGLDYMFETSNNNNDNNNSIQIILFSHLNKNDANI